MGALDSVLGKPGEPIKCRTIGEASVHWWHEPTEAGDWCLCGEMQKRSDNRHHFANGDHCSCWQDEELACCACGYEGDEATYCTGVVS